MSEKIYVIQPILSDNYKRVHDEAIALIESAGATYIGSCFQNIKEINAATFIGSGKLKEIAEVLDGIEGVTVLFNQIFNRAHGYALFLRGKEECTVAAFG